MVACENANVVFKRLGICRRLSHCQCGYRNHPVRHSRRARQGRLRLLAAIHTRLILKVDDHDLVLRKVRY